MKSKIQFSFLAIVALSGLSVGIFADASPDALEKATRTNLAKIQDERKALFASVQNGEPTEAQLSTLDRIAAAHESGERLLKQIQLSRELESVPESERFATAFGDQYGRDEQKNLARLSLRDVIASVKTGRLDGIVREASDEGRREAMESGISDLTGGIMLSEAAVQFMASNAARRRRNATQSVTGTNLGSHLVGTDVRTDLLQPTTLLPVPAMERLGARVLSGLRNNLSLPRIAQTGSFDVIGETDNTTAVDHATSAVSHVPQRIGAHCDFSDQLALQASPDVEALLLSLVLARTNVRIDHYCFNGSGSSQPRGLLNVSGIGAVAIGANGGAPTLAHLIDLESALADANFTGAASYLTNTQTRGRLKKTAVESGQTARVWDIGTNTLNGYAASVCNVLPATLTKGTNSDCSPIILADWTNAVLMFWGGLNFELARDRAGSLSATSTLVVNRWFDFGWLQPKAAAAIKDSRHAQITV